MALVGFLPVPEITYDGTSHRFSPWSKVIVTRTMSLAPDCRKFLDASCGCPCCDDGAEDPPTFTVVIHCPCWRGKPRSPGKQHGCGCSQSFRGYNTAADRARVTAEARNWARERGIQLFSSVHSEDDRGNVVVEHNREPAANG